MVFTAFCREVRGGFPDGRAYVGVKMSAFPVEAELPDDLTADERRVVEDAHAGRATVFPAPENKEDLASWRTVRARGGGPGAETAA